MTYPASTDLDGAGDASVILEAALLVCHLRVTAPKLCDLQVFGVSEYQINRCKNLFFVLPVQTPAITAVFSVNKYKFYRSCAAILDNFSFF